MNPTQLSILTQMETPTKSHFTQMLFRVLQLCLVLFPVQLLTCNLSFSASNVTQILAHAHIQAFLSLYKQANKVLGSVVSVISVSACHLYYNHSRRSASLWSSSSSESSPSSLQKMLIRVAFACLEASIISFAYEKVQQQHISFRITIV